MTSSRLRLIRVLLLFYWLALAIGSHWPRLDLGDNTALPFGVDKWLHVAGYAGLIVLFLSARLGGGGRRVMVARTIVVLLAYALLDELTQHFVSGRTVTPQDYLASCLGLALGASAWLIWMRWRHPATAPVPNAASHKPQDAPEPQPFMAHTRLVSALTLLSRVFGLVRDWALAFAFGFSGVLDAWVVAFMIPNLFRRLFGEGALAAAFIPNYTKLRKDDPEAARQLAITVIARVGAILLLLCVAGFVVLRLLALRDASDRTMLTLNLTSLMLGYMLFVCGSALLGAMLQVHQRFGPPAAAPIVLNVFIIGAALGGVWLAPSDMGVEVIAYGLAGAVMIAGLLQVIWHLVALRSAGVNLFAGVQQALPSVRPAWRALRLQWLPTVLGLAVFQLNVLADALIAMFFSNTDGRETFSLLGYELPYPMQEGAVGVLGATARLYEFPLGVFGIAVATAIFPALAKVADNRAAFTDLLRQGLRLTVFIGLPASVGLVLVRYPLARAIYFEHGSITAEDAGRVAWVLLGYAPAVWAYSMNHVLTRAFYARHDAVTPMRVSIAMVALNVVLNLTLIWMPMGDGRHFGAAGLAWSTAVCAVIQCAILLRLVRRHSGPVIDRSITRSWLQTAVVSVVMTVVLWPLLAVFDMRALGHGPIIVLLGLAVVVGAGIVGGGAVMLGMEELRWLLRRSVSHRAAVIAPPRDIDNGP